MSKELNLYGPPGQPFKEGLERTAEEARHLPPGLSPAEMGELPTAETRQRRRMVAAKSRLTVVETVYHQNPKEQPTCVDSRHTQVIEGDEQVWQRRCKVGEEWTPIDQGWIEACSCFHVRNDEGRFLINPTDAEREEVAARVLEIAFAGQVQHAWLVRPGMTFRGEPSEARSLLIRCRSGEARYTVTFFPG